MKILVNHKNYKFMRGDIAGRGDMKKAIGKGENKIINYSAKTHAGRSIMEPEVFVKTALGFGEEMMEYVKDRPGSDFRYALDSQKLRKLSWQPPFPGKKDYVVQ